VDNQPGRVKKHRRLSLDYVEGSREVLLMKPVVMSEHGKLGLCRLIRQNAAIWLLHLQIDLTEVENERMHIGSCGLRQIFRFK